MAEDIRYSDIQALPNSINGDGRTFIYPLKKILAGALLAVSKRADEKVVSYPTFKDFPEEGEPDSIYIDISNNKAYRWDANGGQYYSVSGSVVSSSVTNGKINVDGTDVTVYTLPVGGDAIGGVKTTASGAGTINIDFTGQMSLNNSGVTVGKYTKVTVDSHGLVTAGETLSASDIPMLTLSKISDAGTAASKNVGNAAGNVPLLDSKGKLAEAIMPALAIGDTVTVANDTVRFALTRSDVQKGDVVIVTGTNKTYRVIDDTKLNVEAGYAQILTPDAVLSVNGKVGTVTLTTTDIAEGNNLYFTNARVNTAVQSLYSTIVTSQIDLARSNTNDKHINIFGGTAFANSASLVLYGGDEANYPGRFALVAQDGTHSMTLAGHPGGTLNWGGNAIALAKDFLPLAGGTMTGDIKRNGVLARNTDDVSSLSLMGGSDNTSAMLSLWGKNNSASPGSFQLKAINSTTEKSLVGEPNGTLKWGGTAISLDGHTHNYAGSSSAGGAATSAKKLDTSRAIDGVNFNGSAAIIHYGTCNTAAATAAKEVACTSFTLVTGSRITVKFTVTNTANNPTLNVNSTGAKAIQYRGSAINKAYLAANRTYEFVYDGTNYQLVGDIDTNSTGYLPLSGGTLTGNVTTASSIIFDRTSGTPAIGTIINIPFTYKTKTTASGNAVFDTSPIFAYPTSDARNSGVGFGIGTGGSICIGAGESGRALPSALALNGGDENLRLGADGSVYIYTNCNTIANRKEISFNTSGSLVMPSGGNVMVGGTALNAEFVISSGNSATDTTVGSSLHLFGKNHASSSGTFSLHTGGSSGKSLIGKSDGSLEWGSSGAFHLVESVVGYNKAVDDGYMKYDHGLLICWKKVTLTSSNYSTGVTWTYPQAFNAVPRVGLAPNGAVVPYINSLSKTSVKIKCGATSNNIDVTIIAVGSWLA